MKQKPASSKTKHLIIFLFTICLILGLIASGWIAWDYFHPVKKPEPQNQTKSQLPIKSVSSSKPTKKYRVKPATPTKRLPTNHLPSADQYAFRTTDVRQAMKGPLNPAKPKVVFLTFDDGPSPNNTAKILGILAQYQVHATFFIVGNAINLQTQELVKKEYEQGNGIGIHSFSHDYRILYPNRTPNPINILNEALKTQQLLKKILGANFLSHVWRFPGGTMSWPNLAPSENLLQQNNFNWIDWNAANGDALGIKSPKSVAEALSYHEMSLKVYPQSNAKVVLMHDTNDKAVTVAALPQIIKFYQDHGYQFGILQ